MRRSVRFVIGSFTAALVALCSVAAAEAQASRIRPLITQPINEAQLQTLKGNTHPLARPEFDQGAAPVDLPMERMLLVLGRSTAQNSALETLLTAQQNPSSPQFHKWLTPQQFGQQFGAADQDIQTITAWLQSHGFQVTNVSNAKNVIEFSGVAGQVEEALHTSIHKYVVNGVQHWANASNPQIPVALTPIVAGVATLHNFTKKSQAIATGATFEAEAGSRPQFTGSGTDNYALAPGDYATIYNINSLYQTGINGAGTTVAIVARTNIDVSDIASFRSSFGLSANNPQIVVNGPDPGDVGGSEEAEAVLDTSWAGATAPGATVKVVVSKTTNTTDGVDLSEEYIIDNNLGDVMTESFGDCETNYSQADATFYSSLAQQAAAEGITYTVAAGDSGAEGCDDPSETRATGGVSVNILASSAYVVAVGGTEFNENGNYSVYWRSINSSTDSSALGYIPEDVWNESCTVATCGRADAGLWAGGGGASIFYAKPSWQAGVAGIPSDGMRDVPDVALTAAGHDAYLLCLDGSCTANSRGRIEFQGYSGTSAATPSFAGIMALVVQRTGARQGQADNVLYTIASAESLTSCNASNTAELPALNCAFNDVTVGNNAVPGESGYGTTSGLYQAGVGYDQASGLGSVNVTNLVNGWTGGGGTPVLVVSPLALNFGTANIGFARTQQISVSNTGTGTLYLATITISQPATDFSFTKTCGGAIVAGENCQLTVSFVPVGTGTRTGTLTIQSSNGSLSQSVALTGIGQATATESFTMTTIGFGSQKVLTPSNPQSVTITNSTMQAFSPGSLAIGGANPADFAELAMCPALLQPGSSCTVYIAFTPQLIGNRSAYITVPLAGVGGQQTIQLTGAGTVTGFFEIVNSLTGKVLDITGGSGTDGTLIQQNALDGARQQQWQLIPTSGGYYEIANAQSGKVLDDTGLSLDDGTLIQEYDYLGGGNQQWQFVAVDDVHYKIVNQLSGKVLDVVGGSTANGAQVQQWSYVGDPQQLWLIVPIGSYNIINNLSAYVLDVTAGSSADGTLVDQTSAGAGREQQWQLMPVGGGYYGIINTLTGKVLDVRGDSSADGAQVQEWDYLDTANQQWQLVPVSFSAGALNFEVVNRLSGKVLDNTGDSTSSGTFIQQWDYLGTPNQQWQFTPVVFYNIMNRMSNAVLDVTGGSSADGALIQQWAPDGFQQQEWHLVPVAGGSFAIVNNLTSKALDDTGSSTADGTLIQQYSYQGGENQQWQLVPVGNGYYAITNSLSGKVLDVLGMSTANGASIQQWDYLAGANQQWQLITAPN